MYFTSALYYNLHQIVQLLRVKLNCYYLYTNHSNLIQFLDDTSWMALLYFIQETDYDNK